MNRNNPKQTSCLISFTDTPTVLINSITNEFWHKYFTNCIKLKCIPKQPDVGFNTNE